MVGHADDDAEARVHVAAGSVLHERFKDCARRGGAAEFGALRLDLPDKDWVNDHSSNAQRKS